MDAASIEQMNKVRASLGMAPLPMPSGASNSGPEFKRKDDASSGSEEEEEDNISTLDKRQAAAGDNWKKLEAERQDKLEREKRKEAAKKARDAGARFAKLEGKGLGDEDEGEELDTRAWLMQQKKRQRKIEKARKMEAELAEREREMQAAEQYTSKDLAGVKVAHEAERFDELAGEQVLTLKDAEIGDESGEDELENAEINAREKLEEKLRWWPPRPAVQLLRPQRHQRAHEPGEQERRRCCLFLCCQRRVPAQQLERGSSAAYLNQAISSKSEIEGSLLYDLKNS